MSYYGNSEEIDSSAKSYFAYNNFKQNWFCLLEAKLMTFSYKAGGGTVRELGCQVAKEYYEIILTQIFLPTVNPYELHFEKY